MAPPPKSCSALLTINGVVVRVHGVGVDAAGGGLLHAAQPSRIFDFSGAACVAAGLALRTSAPTTLAAIDRTADSGGLETGETVGARLT